MTILGWASGLFGVSLIGYVVYALWSGSVVFDTKFSNNTLSYADSPSSYVYAVVFYLASGAMSIWIAKILLFDESKWRRGKGF